MPKPWYARRRLQKKLISFLIAMLIVGAGYLVELDAMKPQIANIAPGYYQVIRADDGDTIVVSMNGSEEKVRFIGVDTPETHDPRKPVQCYGKAASAYTNQRIDNQSVRLETDPLSTNRDRYNRLLRYVYLPDGTLLNKDIIEQGYGFAYLSFPLTKAEEFRQAQTSAREANRGLWAYCNPVPNEYGSFSSPPE